jgi:transcriptional regulator of arginine metabolism
MRAAFLLCQKEAMKFQRHNAIRELVGHALVANQDELRRKLRRRGFEVTQATLSRDIHELRLTKGPNGYSLPNGNGNGNGHDQIDDAPPSVAEIMEGFGLDVKHAMNQVVLRTTMGGAQPMAAALDRERWSEVLGTIAGDDTVLVICPDVKRASEVESRLRRMLES